MVPFLTRTVGVFLVASALEDNANNATKEDHMMNYTNKIDAADLQRLITYAVLHICTRWACCYSSSRQVVTADDAIRLNAR
jgi:hypothetical protein